MLNLFKKGRPLFIQEALINASSLNSLKKIHDFKIGHIQIKNKPFEYHHARAFYDTYKEIFEENIYQFYSTSESPIIIDCGANMGLSVLYFAEKYPNSRIIAFEPEDEIYQVLKRNAKTFDLKNVEIHNKAVWDSETVLNFFTDKGMGGSVTNVYTNQNPSKVSTVKLSDYLNTSIDLLKIDIEGAEYKVLKSCDAQLKNVNNIFVEYHSFVDQEQHLEDLLKLLKDNGFRYHLKQSFSRNKPFIDDTLACENMDMAINIFAYKHESIFTDEYFEGNKLSNIDSPLVSVCVPMYNGEEYIRETLDSIVSQTYSNIEVVVVDDGSNDNSIKIVEEYSNKDSRIKLYRNEKNLGLVGNWERCIEKANGDWIKFLFQDDVMQSRCVEKMLIACIKHDVKFALCARNFKFEENANHKTKETFTYELTKPENVFSRKSYYTPYETSQLISTHLIENVLGEPICTLFHKSLHQQFGGFDANMRQMVDYAYNLKIVLNNSFVFLDEKLVTFRVHSDSTTNKNILNSSQKKADKFSAIRSNIGDFLILLEQYRTNKYYEPIKSIWGEEALEVQEKYIYLRACKYIGVKKVNSALKEILNQNFVLKNYNYSWLKYKLVKYRFKNNIKPYLNSNVI